MCLYFVFTTLPLAAAAGATVFGAAASACAFGALRWDPDLTSSTVGRSDSSISALVAIRWSRDIFLDLVILTACVFQHQVKHNYMDSFVVCSYTRESFVQKDAHAGFCNVGKTDS
jgi:hypothetical protein